MNTMGKRMLALVAVLGMFAVLLTGCGKKEPAPSDTAPTTTTASTLPPTTTTAVNGVMEGEINVREGPGSHYASMGGVMIDESVVIVGREGDWYKIRFGDTYGYINAHYVAVDGQPNASKMQEDRPQATTTTAFAKQSGKVNGETAKVYAAPDAADEPMGEIAKDSAVTITGQVGNWYEIEYNGGIGYIQGADVTKETTAVLTTGTGTATATTAVNGIPNTNADDELG